MMNLTALRRALFVVVVTFLCPVASAELRLPSLFGSHMVLQREQPVPVRGRAHPGATVTVSIRDQTRQAIAAEDGRWTVTLSALTLGNPATMTVASGDQTRVFSDVLVGEVWICSGQSNMFWPVAQCLDPDLETAAARYSQLRLFQVPISASAEPQEDVQAQWKLCSPESVTTFSAVAYFYGRTLQSVLQVPVGLIHTSVGGTPAEAWTPATTLKTSEQLRPMVEKWERKAAEYDPVADGRAREKAMAAWKLRTERAKTQGKRAPFPPFFLGDPKSSLLTPGALYNAMVKPLAPYAVRGAIWYQGESNVQRAWQYRTLMPALIRSWRETWHQDHFPFYMVQLANFHRIEDEPGDSDWAELREAQMLTAATLPDVGVACITDLGEATDVHPKNKQDVGKRLARLALSDVYGYADRITRNGPVYRSVSFADDRATLIFDTLGSELSSWYQDPLKGFAISGADRKWVWAECEITGPDTVDVWHEDVTEPVAVRYNWANNPQGNLYNKHLLPAYPFRTDDWSGITADKLIPTTVK